MLAVDTPSLAGDLKFNADGDRIGTYNVLSFDSSGPSFAIVGQAGSASASTLDDMAAAGFVFAGSKSPANPDDIPLAWVGAPPPPPPCDSVDVAGGLIPDYFTVGIAMSQDYYAPTGVDLPGNINHLGDEMTAAVLLAFEEINNNVQGLAPFKADGAKLLPDTTIKFLLASTQNDPKYAVPAGLNVLGVTEERDEYEDNAFAIIGGEWSGATMALNGIANVYNAPQISGSATNAKLSNKDSYATFMRTAAPDSLQAAALARLVLGFGWTTAATISTNDAYADGLAKDFASAAAALDINVIAAESAEAGANGKNPDSYGLTQQLSKIKKSGVRVIFISTAEKDFARQVLLQGRTLGMTGEGWVWIGADGWSVFYSSRCCHTPRKFGSSISSHPRVLLSAGSSTPQ